MAEARKPEKRWISGWWAETKKQQATALPTKRHVVKKKKPEPRRNDEP